MSIPDVQLIMWDEDAQEFVEGNPDYDKVGHRWLQRTVRLIAALRAALESVRQLEERNVDDCAAAEGRIAELEKARTNYRGLLKNQGLNPRTLERALARAEKAEAERDEWKEKAEAKNRAHYKEGAWRKRAEKAEAEVKRLREALEEARAYFHRHGARGLHDRMDAALEGNDDE